MVAAGPGPTRLEILWLCGGGGHRAVRLGRVYIQANGTKVRGHHLIERCENNRKAMIACSPRDWPRPWLEEKAGRPPLWASLSSLYLRARPGHSGVTFCQWLQRVLPT